MTDERLTPEIAECFGYRDRCQGVDSEERNITISRFNGRKRLEQAYWAGFWEADHYVGRHWDWGRAAAFREMRGGLSLH
jgi:hypothetical protein